MSTPYRDYSHIDWNEFITDATNGPLSQREYCQSMNVTWDTRRKREWKQCSDKSEENSTP